MAILSMAVTNSRLGTRWASANDPLLSVSDNYLKVEVILTNTKKA